MQEGRPAVMASRPSQYFYDSLLHGIGWFFLFFCGIEELKSQVLLWLCLVYVFFTLSCVCVSSYEWFA